MKHKRNWIIGIALSATAAFVALQNVNAPTQNGGTNDSVTTTPETSPIATETTAPAYEGCAFVWATHDAPELTEKLDASVKVLNPDASATASLFGEDCVYADGSSTFGVMETDFHVRLPVDDLTDEEALGNWLAEVMEIVLQITHEEIQGNYGFVEFWFEKKESIFVRVPIQQYTSEGLGKKGTELFRMFYTQP